MDKEQIDRAKAFIKSMWSEVDFRKTGEVIANRAWLEGWIFGVTDFMLHPEQYNERDKLMEYTEEMRKHYWTKWVKREKPKHVKD